MEHPDNRTEPTALVKTFVSRTLLEEGCDATVRRSENREDRYLNQ